MCGGNVFEKVDSELNLKGGYEAEKWGRGEAVPPPACELLRTQFCGSGVADTTTPRGEGGDTNGGGGYREEAGVRFSSATAVARRVSEPRFCWSRSSSPRLPGKKLGPVVARYLDP